MDRNLETLRTPKPHPPNDGLEARLGQNGNGKVWGSRMCSGERQQLGPGTAGDVHLLESSPTGGMLARDSLAPYGPEALLLCCAGSRVLSLSRNETEP